MIRPFQAAACVLMVLFSSVALAGPNEPPPGFKALFNGRDLSGWWGAGTEDPRAYMALPAEQLAEKKQASLEDIRKHWTVENGELVNDGHGLYLTTDENYGDFELLVDYKTVPTADSGIYLRGNPQVQIWDSTEQAKFNIGADKGSGGLWNNPADWPGKDPLVLADNPLGQWNRFRIIMVGDYVTVYLNDKLVVDHARMQNFFDRQLPEPKRSPIPRTGPIQLQTHGGEIRWRNVFIRPIEAPEANNILRNAAIRRGGAAYARAFNGADLSGWTGATQNYEVADGAIVCKPNTGGNLFTDKEYGDFVVLLEFNLPPAGNNGLAIRYPGQGSPAHDGMCEVQVLDDGHEKYAKIDPRQAHGSAYGMVAAHRGYLRPAGQWNFQKTIVKGSTVTVELNGARILQADLSQVSEFMGNQPHPGKDRTQGHFGFAGHGDPVRFREIYIKMLE